MLHELAIAFALHESLLNLSTLFWLIESLTVLRPTAFTYAIVQAIAIYSNRPASALLLLLFSF